MTVKALQECEIFQSGRTNSKTTSEKTGRCAVFEFSMITSDLLQIFHLVVSQKQVISIETFMNPRSTLALFFRVIPTFLFILSIQHTSPTASALFFKHRVSSELPQLKSISIMPSSIKTSPADLPKVTHSKYEKKAAGFWNRISNFYFKQPIKDEEAYLKKLEMTREYLTPQSDVLEFGCGTGGTAIKHASYVKTIRGIDISKNMVEIAEKQAKDANVDNVTFQCIGIDSLQAPKASYDVVMGMSILHLLPNKDKVLERVYELVKPGGYFVSSTTCMGDFAGTFLKYVAPSLSGLGIMPKLNVFTKEELKDSIQKAGFSIEEEYQPGDGKDKEAAVFLVARKIG